ncbi:MAG: pilt protein domain protein [Phycisphaerales bacterium]|nr:pilt protein domain protein [Phycisphaerales bacterium]
MSAPRQAVFDCNVYLQAMLSARGAAHACWQKVVAGEVVLYVTPFILAEIRRLPDHKNLRRLRSFTHERVERFIEELLDNAALVSDPPPKFAYPRDPDDARYVDVAISTGAILIVSNDKDLLDLMNDSNPEGKALRERHPTFGIFTPAEFLKT